MSDDWEGALVDGASGQGVVTGPPPAHARMFRASDQSPDASTLAEGMKARRRFRRRPREYTGTDPQHARTDIPVFSLGDDGQAAILDAAAFCHAVRREKRRADRSRMPVSLTLFRVEATGAAGISPPERLVCALSAARRETDYLAQLDDGVFAVLFPDTAEAGAQRFCQRLRMLAEDVVFSMQSATYPRDQLEEFVTLSLRSGRTARAAASRVPHPGSRAERRAPSYFLKRPLDVLGAALGLILLSPIMLVTAIAIRVTSPGPIVFRQMRLGQGGVPFVFYKFRSMRVDADDGIHRQYVQDLIKGRTVGEEQAGAGKVLYKIGRDPRVTPVGRIIRKTSIDELPQLWNVLKGDMSLVGPRPPIPYEAESYESWHLRRVLDVKPGITGLWQVAGRSRVSFDDMVRMDLKYIRNCSLALDLRILMRTVAVVLRCDGAT